jgi:ABC-type transport system involved in cytochrome bd biosynthesis fused ATPase/permease subunit
MLKDKTILFVCNNLCYLNKMDKILIFSGGRLRIIENLQIDLINLIGFDKRSS